MISFCICRYDVALDTNTKGAKHLISFAKKCKELKLLLHISTGMQKIGLISPSINREVYEIIVHAVDL